MESGLTALGAWCEAQAATAEPRIRLESSAEPGWKLVVDLTATSAFGRPFERIERFRAHADWLVVHRNEAAWHARCGVRNLEEAIALFLDWVDEREAGPQVVAPLDADLLAQVQALGVDPDFAGLYGPDRLRWALDALQAAQRRGPVRSPAAWVEQTLEDHWGRPKAVVQRPLPFAEAAARAAAPPVGTKWAREKATGRAFEVLDADPLRVQLKGGVAVPSHLWGGWEWLVDAPPEAPPEPVEDPRRALLGRMKAWSVAAYRPKGDVAAKLASLGLTAEEWDQYLAEGHPPPP